MASLTLENLTCEFRTRRGIVRAVDDLCLDLSDGDLVVLVGPSGCGKSTTLRLIAGLESPTAGAIRLAGRSMNKVPPRDRDVAMVFQNFALYPHMTVYKNLAFGLRMRGTPGALVEHAVSQVAAKLGLNELLDRKPHQLSGGEKQRVALGRAIIRKPQLFLLDEPLSNLDLSMRAAARAEIKRIQRELATTMLYVTHDQEEAMTLADRIGVLKEGRLQQFAPPLEIYNRPANRFVAGFFGSPPMNLLTGNLQMEAGCTMFRSGAMQIPIESAGLPNAQKSTEVVLGIRPHDIRLVSAPDGLQATIRSIEPLGDADLIRVAIDDSSDLVAKASPAESLRMGETIRLELPMAKLHAFSADADGRRLI